jgi:D-hexose-6-phosphate mutarotase
MFLYDNELFEPESLQLETEEENRRKGHLFTAIIHSLFKIPDSWQTNCRGLCFIVGVYDPDPSDRSNEKSASQNFQRIYFQSNESLVSESLSVNAITSLH